MTLERKLSVVCDDAADADSATSVKVAFASADRKHIDQHFGAAEGFVLYSISASGYELLEAAQFGRLDMDGNEDKLGAKIDVLRDCIAVYCQAIGASAIRQLRGVGVQPIKAPAQTLISGLLRELQRELSEGPSAWLARAIDQRQPRRDDRFEVMEAEGWRE
ncbi:MAG: NifB/NifX family molybdenum-iron cluster-binding protein [Thiohalocapsa sp.]